MSSELLSIILDIVILICLGVTIYYALRLSRSLNNFRTYRKEFDVLIQELNRNIEHAYEALRAMKESSTRSSDDLEDMYRQSQQMSEELKLINETSNSLADRLERVAMQNRVTVRDESDVSSGEFLKNVRRVERPSDDGFAIQDLDFQDDGDDDGAFGQSDDGEGFQSEAEKDLYNALKKNMGSGHSR